ncbi:YeiH family protein [Virgibacillus ainsalahensis]
MIIDSQYFKPDRKKWKWFGGVMFTFFIALLGYLLALLPGFSFVGQLACAIIIAIIYSQIFGFPEAIREGVTFSAKKLLRLAIILYGLRLNINIVLSDGLGLLVRDVAIITLAILLMMWLAKVLKADSTISLLLGVGTGVCGAAAIAAVAPIVKAKDEDTAIGVGIIALMGTVFSIIYIIIRPILPISDVSYGIWSGMSLHELAHVALAAAPAGDEALAMALLAKLGRVFLLVPLCFILIFMMKAKHKGSSQSGTKVAFPWFLVGFIALSILGTYVFGESIPVSDTVMDGVFELTTWLLTAAMAGLGLSVNLNDLRSKAMKPLIAMIITSVTISVVAYFIV